ncbi:hypothetical protein O181_062210, partial [Austropuccinia psidii MF-1]|nr:hypothetical protein [Austropuccinia psidii MF-1]
SSNTNSINLNQFNSLKNLNSKIIHQSHKLNQNIHSISSPNNLFSISNNLTNPSSNHPKLLNSSKSSPISSLPQNSNGPPYAYAYELYDRRIARVQPTLIQDNHRPNNLINNNLHSNLQPIISNQKNQTYSQQPAEVCIECMMRDRDMVGIDVISPGVWDRKSDIDFHQAMAQEENDSDQIHSISQDHNHNHHLLNSHQNKSNENLNLDPNSSNQSYPIKKKRLGRGNPLTANALKTWTQMNPPAASHRWKTLKLYLAEQRHNLELEYRAKLSTQVESEWTEQLIRNSLDPINQSYRNQSDSNSRFDVNFLNPISSRLKSTQRGSTSTLLSTGILVEKLDVSKDEKEADKYRANDQKLSHISRPISSASINPNGFFPSTSFKNSKSNSHYTNSSNFKQTINQHSSSIRPPSPSHYSLTSRKSTFGESIRPISMWSRIRRSGSHSIFSLAPSGSMLDMHLGLSQDRDQSNPLFKPHLYHHQTNHSESLLNQNKQFNPSLQQTQTPKINNPEISQFTGTLEDLDQKRQKKKLKKTFKGFLGKLGIGRKRSSSIDRISSPNPSNNLQRNKIINLNHDDEPLVPPPSLSVLAREQQIHRRNRSALSLPLSTSGKTFKTFRPQSISTATVGIDSALSSPASQFIPISPCPNSHFNGTGPTSHTSPYMQISHDPNFDSLAEELETPIEFQSHLAFKKSPRKPSPNQIIQKQFIKSVTSLADGQSSHLQNHKSLDPQNNLNHSFVNSKIESIKSSNQSNQEDLSQSTGIRSSSGTNKTSSIRTVMSKSSKILSIMPGLKNRVSSGGSIILSNSAIGLRSSTSTQFSNPLQTEDLNDQHQLPLSKSLNHEIPNNFRPNYLPIEKSRQGVTRSSDFLALRYVSVGNENRI